MLFALALSATISASAAPSIVDELTPPPWPAGMVLEEYPDGSVWLNKVAADATHEHVEFADRAPELGGEVLAARLKLAQVVFVQQRAVDAAQHAAALQGLQANQATWCRKLQWVGIGGLVGGALVLAAIVLAGAL